MPNETKKVVEIKLSQYINNMPEQSEKAGKIVGEVVGTLLSSIFGVAKGVKNGVESKVGISIKW